MKEALNLLVFCEKVEVCQHYEVDKWGTLSRYQVM